MEMKLKGKKCERTLNKAKRELETMIKYRTKGATLMSVNLNGTMNVRKTLNTFSI